MIRKLVKSGVAHPELDRLLDFSLRFAKDMLKKRGKFYPFAATVDANNELKPLAVHSGDDRPKPQEVLDRYSDLLKALASSGEAKAVAVCYDSLVSSAGEERIKRDAIAVALEHSNGESVLVYLPYQKKLLGGHRYESLIALVGERKYFP